MVDEANEDDDEMDTAVEDSNDRQNDSQHGQQTSLIIEAICRIFNMREFCNKINVLFANTNDKLANQYNLNQLSLDISYICYFLLIKSKLKIHESM